MILYYKETYTLFNSLAAASAVVIFVLEYMKRDSSKNHAHSCASLKICNNTYNFLSSKFHILHKYIIYQIRRLMASAYKKKIIVESYLYETSSEKSQSRITAQYSASPAKHQHSHQHQSSKEYIIKASRCMYTHIHHIHPPAG